MYVQFYSYYLCLSGKLIYVCYGQQRAAKLFQSGSTLRTFYNKDCEKTKENCSGMFFSRLNISRIQLYTSLVVLYLSELIFECLFTAFSPAVQIVHVFF